MASNEQSIVIDTTVLNALVGEIDELWEANLELANQIGALLFLMRGKFEVTDEEFVDALKGFKQALDTANNKSTPIPEETNRDNGKTGD